MDRSRLVAGAGPAVEVVFVAAADLASSGAVVVVVDLTRCGDPAALVAPAGARVVAFGPHVDDALLDSARRAGIAEVLPRSVFFRRLGELLGG
jgi:hypothetical protein